MSDLPQRADVVVIGGGAVGASTAFHLATGGVSDVVLLERETLASGSTSRSAGGARLQFADELNVRLSLRSLEEFERWDALIGEHVSFVPEIAFHQVGYLFLLDTPEQVATFRAALAVQGALGVPSRELTPAEAAAIVPQLELEGVLAATFCPRDGHMSPEAVVQGYAAAAAARGARIVQGCPATGIDQQDGRITGVRTARGTIATDTVVCAAGAWSGEVGALAGIEIPVHGEPRHMWFSPEHGGVRDDVPLTIDFSTSFYFHREGPGLVFGGREPALEDVAEHALERLPLIADLPIQSSWWGYYEVSPDHNAIVGEAPGPGRFLYATGFSGHGFQQAPAIGEHLARLIRGEQPAFDLGAFALERFARGEQRAEQFVV
jgi:glycine/D-amino acid oxidase-like deaminating enzyme